MNHLNLIIFFKKKDPSDPDADRCVSTEGSSSDECARKQLINSSSTTTNMPRSSSLAMATAAALEDNPIVSSSSDYQDLGCESSVDETFKNSEEEERDTTTQDESNAKADSLTQDESKGMTNGSSSCTGFFPCGNCASANANGPKRENLLRKRIMKLPLSPLVKSFLLYYRDI